jgi:hypothetical protein
MPCSLPDATRSGSNSVYIYIYPLSILLPSSTYLLSNLLTPALSMTCLLPRDCLLRLRHRNCSSVPPSHWADFSFCYHSRPSLLDGREESSSIES